MTRPSKHIRVIRTKRGRKAVMVNPDIRKKKRLHKLQVPNNYTGIEDGEKLKTGVLSQQEFETYKKIAQTARRKGYAIPRLDLERGPIVVDEINIPKDFQTEGLFVPDFTVGSGKDVGLIALDDDVSARRKDLIFAHELGHVHLDEMREKNTEAKADEIGADIMGISKKDYDKIDTDKDIIGPTQFQKYNRIKKKVLSRRKSLPNFM
jgi:hypothetical protein